MQTHLDWVSWTLETKQEPVDQHQLKTFARVQIHGIGEEHYDYLFDGQTFGRIPGRAPYRLCLERDDKAFRVYGGSPTGTILYELTGTGCAGLHDLDSAGLFISPIRDRVTRLDIATDIRTSTTPTEFTDSMFHQRFRSKSVITSDTGETVYVGSPKSGRFCRVYRYNPPHPRSVLLRVEFVFRGKLAKSTAVYLLQQTDKQTMVAALGNTFGFSHDDWKPSVETDEKLIAPTSSKDEQDTLMWLYKQVVPAMKRLIASGTLSMTDFLEEVYR